MRKALLGTIVLLIAGLTGCAPAPRTVSVIAIWTGAEEQAFRQILDAFTARTGIVVDYHGTRAVDQVLASDVEKGTPPDIAILSRPNDLARYQRSGDLKPLDEVTGAAREAAERQPWQWKDGGNRLYTVAVKEVFKSRIWSRSAPPSRPLTWNELSALTRDGQSWCLGVGALSTTGWPGTDWIEDILLHQSGPEIYRQWVSGTLPWTSAQVRHAWQTWGSTVVGPGANIDALLTDFADATRKDCVFVHQADPPWPGFTELPFPDFGSGVEPVVEVGGDSAARFTTNPAAQELIQYLAERGRASTPDLFARGRPCFTAADLMPPAMTNAFYRSVLEYLANPGALDTLLTTLDHVRQGIPKQEWLTVACARAP